MSAKDTIVALSSPVGESALAIIRISGADSPTLANAIRGINTPLPPRKALLCKYVNINGLEVDQGIFISYSENSSFTGESMLEIMPHGNPLIVQIIIEDLLARGCRMAEPGEFTKRAFFNGKMDLSQAEAVADIIHARSQFSLEVARKQLKGSIGQKMSSLTEFLLGILADIEAYIDFPEEDLPPETQDGPRNRLNCLISEVEGLIETNQYTALLNGAIKAIIIGPPNAGKSSLINKLVGSERALVSSKAGTTRDFISSSIMLDDYRIEIIDTAGLHPTTDPLEIKGIEKTLQLSQEADFYLFILDYSSPTPILPKEIAAVLSPKNTIVIENKKDLDSNYSHNSFIAGAKHSSVSLKENIGIKDFKIAFKELVESNILRPKNEDAIIINARHTNSLRKALKALKKCAENIDNQQFSEIIAQDLRHAIYNFGEVVGKVDNEAMLDKLFQNFCIGK